MGTSLGHLAHPSPKQSPEQCSQTCDTSEINLRACSLGQGQQAAATDVLKSRPAAQAPIPAVGGPSHPCLRVTRQCLLQSTGEINEQKPCPPASAISPPVVTHFLSHLPNQRPE